jgi:hypothetical protein
MKRISFMTALLCALAFIFGVGWTSAQADGIISIDKVEGLIGGDTVAAGQPIRMVMRFNNNTGLKCDVSNGWRMSSPDGASWDSLTMDSAGIITVNQENKFMLYFPIAFAYQNFTDGVSPDTVGVLGAGAPLKAAQQMPATFNDTAMAVVAWFSNKSAAGKHICIDTSFYQPGGTWQWIDKSLGFHYPSFTGLSGQAYHEGTGSDRTGSGYCFLIYDPDAPKVTVSVTPGPLTFNATEGSTDPTPQVLHIEAVGGGPLTYNLNWDLNWITTNKLFGTTPDSVVVSPKIAGLTAGVYIDSIQVAAAGATNSPLYIKVTFNVAARPKVLKVKPDTLYFSGIENGSNPATQNFTVEETGNAAIAYVASKQATWISLTNPSGTTPGNVTVGVNLSGIPAGTYFDSVVVVSGGASNSPIYDYIKLTVTAPETKTLATIPDTLFFTAQENGGNPPQQFFLVWEAAGKVIPYSAVKHTAWVTLSKDGGNTPDSVGVSVNITGVTAGTYLDSVIVTSTDAAVTNSRKVFAKLTVSACPVLLASKVAYYDTVFVDQPAFVGDSIRITSSGDALSWAVTNIGSGFNILTTTGNTPGTLAFTFDQSYGTPGNYSSCFQVETALPVLRRANKDCTSALQVCVSIVVKERPCVQLHESDTAFYFEGFENAGLIGSKPMSVSLSDTTIPILWTVSRPDSATWLKFSNGIDTLASLSFINGANFQIVPNDTLLAPGTYSAVCTISSTHSAVCAPKFLHFWVWLHVKKVVIPSTDTLMVSNVPAVPGAQVPVPVNFVNSCPLVELSVPLEFDQNNLHLDSVSYVGSRFAGGVNQAIISPGMVQLTSTAAANQTVPGGSGLLANLYFSLNPLATPGVYGIHVATVDSSLLFERRQCTDSITTEYPEFIPGSIVTDTVSDYVCGWVVDPNGNQIPGASVQLYAAFPQGSPELTTVSTGIGSFAFSGLHSTPFDLYATKDGYYPGILTKLNFGAKGVKIVLTPLKQFTPTSEWVDYFCASNTLFGGPIPKGSVVEAMDGSLLVGRWVVSEVGKYGFMPVYRANDQFGDNGAKTGDVITFFVDGYPAMTNGNTVYPAQYAQEEVCLDAGATITKSCDLQSGWNLVSWNVDTPNDSIVAVLNSIAGCVDVVLGFEGGGLTYDPALPQFSTLMYADHLSGYWIKIKEDCSATLTETGLPVNPSTPIPVYSGWNLVSYLPDATMSPDNGFASVMNSLLVGYGYDNGIKVYKPDQAQFNTLTTLGPCNGYWLKVNADGALVYPGISSAVATMAENPHARAARLASASLDIKPTTSWMNLYSRSLLVDGKPVPAGAVLAAVTPNNVKVGSFTVKQTGTFGFMPVYSDAGSSEVVTGLKPGDQFSLTINGVATDQTFEWTNNGDRLEITRLTSKATAGNLPTAYSLAQNYPNPFNPSTTINFALPQAGNAKVEVYNVLGALVAVPFNGMLEAGNHSVVWDGKDAHGQPVASGVYFYRMSAGSYTDTKKMMLLK